MGVLDLDTPKSVSTTVDKVTDTVSSNVANVEADIKGYESDFTKNASLIGGKKRGKKRGKKSKTRAKVGGNGWVNCGYRNAGLCGEYGETEYCTPAQCRKWVKGHGKKAKKKHSKKSRKLSKSLSSWIMHVKKFAKDHKIKYPEAMKHPKCKATFKKH